jgi:hypothetical protein
MVSTVQQAEAQVVFLTIIISSARYLKYSYALYRLLENCFCNTIVYYREGECLEELKINFVRIKDDSSSIAKLMAYTLCNRPTKRSYLRTLTLPGPHYFQDFELAIDRGYSSRFRG